jgi:hypothetical protein
MSYDGMSVGGQIVARTISIAFDYGFRAFFSNLPNLPKKMHYIDWKPHIQQLAGKVASTYWCYRLEGLLVGLATFGSLSAASFAGLKWRVFQIFPKNPLIASAMVAPIVGFGVTLSLGTYDLIRQFRARSPMSEMKPSFNLELQETIDNLIEQVSDQNRSHDIFQNLLLYGPPGTGKTMISQWLSKHSNMNYMMVSGADLAKVTVDEFNHLLDHASSTRSPTLIFIDEAESFCGKRDKLEKQQLELLTLFLNRTGNSNSRIMWVLATNRVEILDEAVANRMDVKLFIPLPDLDRRKQIIEMHLPFFFPEEKQREIAFSKGAVHRIAEKTESLSGRTLVKLLNRLTVNARKKPLTDETIDSTIKLFIKQEQQIQAVASRTAV